ncbi:DNA replication factor Dna2-domain-containing protein [Lobosporangium transversale]|uniref:DNA helicase n=1 Tax=Lobosporangium transversale TaxID=64571 RepID=A0A1Y2GZW6_9FUNG|nr:DNA replication factor Dna2-domain-containing protein [Lobosporangium transversale]ORZ27847.1 DNA replication factor Dna2-domain-containing protein [Lobosporangium transversale]|eukprot:XP_021885550.1 DNA replication factor Dna2-domain-containing protein [Lobosporangium transversale]
MGTKSSYSLVSSPVINTSSAPRAITSTASLTKTHTTIKPRRTIILDEDGGNNGGNSHNTDPRQERIAARSVLAARPSRPTSRAEILNRHSTGDRKRSMGLKPLRKEDDETLPFEERMPVSPPGSPGMNARPPLFQEPKQDALITAQQDPRVESISASMIAPSEIMNTGPSSGPCSTNTGPSTPPKKSDSNCNTSTSVNTPPQRSKKNPSPFRTPDKSRRSRSAMESLGLSPQDSVFWVRTPPMEALKKLGRMNTGQSHEEEVASIVGRLYQTSSAGAALRSMPRGPKDRIKDMLNTIRMSSAPPFQDLHEDLDDTEDGDPASPTKKLMERRKNVSNSRQSLVKSNTALERGRAGRRYGRAHQYNKKTLNQLSPNHSTPCPQRREDILKMIDQINANMAAPSNPGTSDSDDEAAPLDSRSSIRPTESDSVPKTPLRDLVSASSQLHFSPGEFDNFFDDLDMDDHDFEELTQLELVSSMSPGFAAADMSISSVSTSAASCGGGDRTFYDVRQELSELGRERAENLREGWRNVTDSVADNVTTTTDTTAEPEGAGLSLNEELIVEEVTEYQERINIKKASTLSSGDFDDFADLGDDFELEDDDLYDTPLTFNVQAHIDSVKYRRFKIIKIMDGIMDPRWYGPSKALFVTDDRNQTPAKIFLRDSWMTSRIDIGDIVHTISAFIYKLDILELMLDDHQGFLIVKPDSLVSTSVLAESFNCIRKPIIDIRARKTDETTVPLIHGTMLHELFQQSLRSNDFSTESMEARLDDIIKLHLNDLCLISESIDVARERISELIPACQDWARKYLRNSPCAEAIVDNTMGHTLNNEYSLLCVNKILDIEENIWSPMFGLKGKIDASIQVVLKTMKKNMDPAIAETKILTVPFELKTGKKSNVISHRAQTMLYTLLMTDRYDVDVQWGLLFYLKAGELIRVNAPHDQIRAILFQRNEIAAYEEQKLSLPPMVQDSQKCGRCFSFSSCTVLHKLLEDGTAESSGLGAMFDEVTDHLSSTHAEFLRKWNRLLALEQGDVAKFQSQIWSMLSVDRQASGNCFSNLELIEEPKESNNRPRDLSSSKDIEFSMSGRFARHQYRFKLGAPPSSLSQQTLSQTLRGGLSLLSSNISVGDPIVVSSEGNHFALAMGYVLDMSLTEITVGLDRPLLGPPMRLEGFDQERNQSYRGLISIENPVPSSGNTEEYYSNLAKNKVMFRLDKDEMSAGIARTRNNLVQLFRADADGGDSKRRRLIVDLERPEFEPIHDFKRQDLLDLNGDQCRAVEAVLAARDYALILGMPGTGKTTTIAQIIHILVRQGKSVLLTSYTHSAVDNVLLKFLKLGQRPDTNVVRLGAKL